MGCLPISVIIKSRRLNYLHYLVSRKENEMLYKFFSAQWKYPVKNDWTEQVKLDLEEFEISSNLEWIRSKSKLVFKKLVRSKAKEVALETLNEIKKKHSKMDSLFYVDLEMQDYLKDRRLKHQWQILFSISRLEWPTSPKILRKGGKPNHAQCARNQML